MIDENIILRRELVDALEQQVQLNQAMNRQQIVTLLQGRKWSTNDQRCYTKIIQNLNHRNMTPANIIDQYINTLISNKYRQEGQSSLISKLTEQLDQLIKKQRQTPNYPTAFVEFEKITCQFVPKYLNLYYRIDPSNHPGAIFIQISQRVTVMNESYTLELPDKIFKISFYRDGNMIGRWEFDGLTAVQGQEASHEIQLEAPEGRLTVTIRVKYVNKKEEVLQYIGNLRDQIEHHQQLLNQLAYEQSQLLNFKQYFFKQHKTPVKLSQILPPKAKQYDCTNNHVKNCYYLLQIQILCECLASFCSPVPYISILVPFYLILKIHDITQNVRFIFGMGILCQATLTIYTILSVFVAARIDLEEKGLLYFSCLVEIGTILMLGLVIIHADEFKQQAEELIVRKR